MIKREIEILEDEKRKIKESYVNPKEEACLHETYLLEKKIKRLKQLDNYEEYKSLIDMTWQDIEEAKLTAKPAVSLTEKIKALILDKKLAEKSSTIDQDKIPLFYALIIKHIVSGEWKLEDLEKITEQLLALPSSEFRKFLLNGIPNKDVLEYTFDGIGKNESYRCFTSFESYEDATGLSKVLASYHQCSESEKKTKISEIQTLVASEINSEVLEIFTRDSDKNLCMINELNVTIYVDDVLTKVNNKIEYDSEKVKVI